MSAAAPDRRPAPFATIVGVTIGLIGIGTVIFYAGAAWQTSTTTSSGYVTLSDKVDKGFDVLNKAIAGIPLTAAKVEAMVEDIRATKQANSARNDAQDARMQELHDRSLSDHQELGRVGDALRDLVAGAGAHLAVPRR